jgi:hypothetical protein
MSAVHDIGTAYYMFFPMDFLKVRTAESVALLSMLKIVKSPPIRAQMLVRNLYKGGLTSEITTAIGDIW